MSTSAVPPVPQKPSGSGSGGNTTTGGGSGGLRVARKSVPQRQPKHAKGSLTSYVVDPTHVVRFGEMTQEEADEIWKRCLVTWGVGNSMVSDRELLFDRVAQALAISTSKDEENLSTRFTLDSDTYLDLRPIHDHGLSVSPGKNDSYLRLFTRSYSSAKFACAITDILQAPENVELRTEVASRTGGPLEDAYLMTDVFPATYRYGGRVYTASELNRYNTYRVMRTSGARDAAAGSGFASAQNDTATTKRATVESVMAPVPKAAANIRTGFTPLDPRQ